jgi:DNA-binding MarR family transcriptional regulator
VLRSSVLRLTRLIRLQRAVMSVTLAELSAMGQLAKNGPMGAGELAACEGVQPPSMTKVLANLEALGLCRRYVHPTDRRQAIIAITGVGRNLLESERATRDAWLAARLTDLTPEDRALLHKVVPILERLIAQPPNQSRATEPFVKNEPQST